jgi:hypothetical protein
MKFKLLSFIFVFGIYHLSGQEKLLTTAERTNYDSTSTYRDVMHFVGELQKQSDLIRVETIATSTEGRKVSMMVIGNPLPKNTGNLNNDKRVVVYIEGNIHAGEVEGKEATQMLARYLLENPDSEILKNVIVLINPILNPDGNEKFSIKNRTNQNGPPSVGVRYNGQNLDLNRDAMKLETPEIRGLVTNVLNKWDPAVFVDCHTTNGSYHEEPVTFVWMMNPNGNRSLINYMRDKMMPEVHNTLKNKYDVDNIFYGEFIDRLDYDKGWISYAAEPRYVVNYVGVRNRLAILNENYVYADFKTRVNGSYHLLLSILDYAASHADSLKSLLANVDEQAIERGVHSAITDSFAISYEGEPTPEKITIKSIEADTIPGMKGYWRFKQSNRKRTVIVDYIADYYATKSIVFPYAYLIPDNILNVIDNLLEHGIIVEQLRKPETLKVNSFKIDDLKPSKKLNQGHYTEKVEGKYNALEREFPAGTFVIRTNQPLGNLAVYLLEPQADDGLLYWNFFDRYLEPQWGSGYFPFPVYRLEANTDIETNIYKQK